MNQDELLNILEDQREDFLDSIDSLSIEAMLEIGVIDGWCVKDIIAHLSAWEAELVKMLWQLKQGRTPSSIHFTNLDVDAQNAVWLESHRLRPLDRVLADFAAIRKQTVRRVEEFSDAELNDPNRYPILKKHPLWEWIAEDSYKHEAEHAAQIRSWRGRVGK
jgi:hypothetical protein